MASSSNALLSWEDENGTHRHVLWVMEYSQPQQLTGSKAQSRTKAHFYPRAHAPGNITVSGRCESQADYQRLALFIRRHQRSILNVPHNERFARINTTNPGYKRLLRLSIPTENLYVRGWIDKFSISKKGVFEPVPEYRFDFFVVFDATAVDIGISHRIRSYYSASDYTTAAARASIENRDKPSEYPDGLTLPEITRPNVPGAAPDPRIP